MTLAAYLDGRLDDPPVAAIEAHLAACDTCLETVRQTRATLAAGPAFLSEPALARARSLASPGALERRPAVVMIERACRWGLAAAAAIAVCVSGYTIGAATTPAAPGIDGLAADLTFGVIDAGDDEDIERVLLAMVNREDER